MANTRDFLFELGVEEMPSAPLNNAVKQLESLMGKGLDEAGLAHGAIRVISSPRRLAVLVGDVAEATQAIHSVLRGPSAKIAFDAEGNPTKAAEGFARKNGLTARELVRREDADGSEYVFAEQNTPSEPALPILTRVCEGLIPSIQWPNYRSQRWGSEHATFVRPVRWICCLFGEEVVPVSFADVVSGNTTRGHRVLSPGEHLVASTDAYEDVLESAHVLSAERREQVIREGIAKVESELGVRVDTPAKVFDEVVNLCEWPTVLVGHFDEEFLNVPSEIICESMLSNQRYFPTYDAEGNLTRAFVVVSNGDPKANATVIDGNERVVRARLYDAKFFYDEDLKVDLEVFRERLASVGFQQKLGTVLQKSVRMEDLALAIAREAHLGAHAASSAQRAAHLAKADLVSSAVVEFTSQQGVMGGYYAAAAGEEHEVAAAIRDHYRPRFAGDDLPEGIAGCIVAVADKLDTIAGMFAIDEPPTGSKDPFALRRSAIGVLNILRTRLKCGYEAIVDAALEGYLEQGLEFDKAAVAASVCAFIKGRMAQMARDGRFPPTPWPPFPTATSPFPCTSSSSRMLSRRPAPTTARPSPTSPPLMRALLTSPTRSSAPRSTASSWATPSLPCWMRPTPRAMRLPPRLTPVISSLSSSPLRPCAVPSTRSSTTSWSWTRTWPFARTGSACSTALRACLPALPTSARWLASSACFAAFIVRLEGPRGPSFHIGTVRP